MRIATWNVNSIRTRVGRVVDWMVREDVDVLAMQEIKCKPEQFPRDAFEDAGYELALHGFNQWNGVAIASRSPIESVETSFPGMPGFLKGVEGPDQPQEARAIGATVDGVRLWSLYVPNGRALGDPHYSYKLDWLAALAEYTRAQTSAHPEVPFALMGDFNIAPFDDDNGDPTVVVGADHPRLAARARGVLHARGRRRHRRRARRACPRAVHLLGLQAAAVPPQRGHAHRLHPRLGGLRRRGDGCLDPPQRAQGRRAVRPRAGARRPRPRRRPTTTCR